MATVRYITTDHINSVNDNQWRILGNTRQVERVKRYLEPGTKYPVVNHFFHDTVTSPSVRCGIGLPDGSVFYLELPAKLFNDLPTAEVTHA